MIMKKWYYADDGASVGPFYEDELQKLASNKVLTIDTLVWTHAPENPGLGWIRAGDAEISTIFSPPDKPEKISRVSRAEEIRVRGRSGKIILSAFGLAAATTIAAAIFIAAWPKPMSADEFLFLCRSGTSQEIKTAIHNKAELNSLSAPLIAAILNKKNNDPGVIEEFAKKGADMNIRDGKSNFTALMYATAANKLEILQELIRNGADINARDNEGCPALMYAISINQPAIIRELIKNGADLNARDSFGRSAFSLAITPNIDPVIVIEFIENGANVNEFVSFKDDFRTQSISILMLAIINKCDIEVISSLIENGADINAETTYGDTALTYAISKNSDPRLTIELIRRGADVNKKYFLHHGAAFQYTSLMWAIVNHNDITVISELINHGADVKARNPRGPSALDCAVVENYEEARVLLKKHGAK
jgi:ankyrin repeat protein